MLDRGGETLPEAWLEQLPPWRRARTEKLRNETARQESLAAGLLWVRAMECWGADPLTPVELLPAGKPVFSAGMQSWFSLSHSGRYVLCAVSSKSVGADVQQMRKVNLSMARRFHPGEQAWLAEQKESGAEEFFRLWTRKEAWVKAESGERMLSLSQSDVIHELPGWSFWDYELPGGYRAAVCSRTAETPELTFLTAEEFFKT